MLTEEIGEVAGKIWHHLHENGGSTVARLKKEIGAPADLVLQGLGWLAREGKVEFQQQGKVLTIRLK
jgi:hypothetical protein